MTGGRAELSEFLVARRSALQPEQIGLRRGGRRRVRGLRREEVALLAGVGVTWYTWLEQGREIRVSTDALGRIAAALRLSASDSEYLFALCGVSQPARGPSAQQLPRSVLEAIDHFLGPALILGPTLDVLAANPFAEELYEFDAFPGEHARNLLARVFLDESRRRFYVDFEPGVRNIVALFRMNAARCPGDPRFQALIEQLSARCPEFVAIWRAHETSLPTPLLLRLCSPRLGRLDLHSVRFEVPGHPHHLVGLLPPANEETRRLVLEWALRRGGADARRSD